MTDIPTAQDQPESPKRSLVLAGVLGMIGIFILLSMTGGTPLLRLLGLTKPLPVYFFSGRTLFWLWLGLMWWYAARVEKQPLLLWRERKQGALHYAAAPIALAIVIIIAEAILYALVYAVTHKTEHSEALKRMVFYLRAHPFLLYYTVITAGVTEELLFRGYLLPRLELLIRNRQAAIFLSSLLFGLGHYGFGTFINIAGAMVIGWILALYYDRWRNIKVMILFHILWDTAGLYLNFRHP
jgi:uncharacterized protein